MTERKNIWDILANRELDIQQEYENLWTLIEAKNTVSQDAASQNDFRFSVLEIINKNFIDFKSRGTFITFDQLLSEFGFRYKGNESVQTIDKLDLFIETVMLMFQEIRALNYSNVFKYRYNYSDIRDSIAKNIKLILQKSHQKVVEIEPNKKIIVPDDEVVTTVSDIILPENERLALSILGYSHYSNKDNLEAKRKILLELWNYIEPKMRKKKDGDISFVMNKYLIRHGDNENLENAEKLGKEKLNDLYDLLYRDVLFYLLGQEHSDFAGTVAKLKASK